jgi:CheY-like chemotaxis protein
VDTPIPSGRGEPAWRGSGLALVADDEESVRATVSRMLEMIGFTTRLAEDGQIAVDAFRAAPESFQLVVLDLTMPHMDGEEAFRQIRGIRADTRVLLMSGFNEQQAIERFAGKGLAGFLQKPFTVHALREKLQHIFQPE